MKKTLLIICLIVLFNSVSKTQTTSIDSLNLSIEEIANAQLKKTHKRACTNKRAAKGNKKTPSRRV